MRMEITDFGMKILFILAAIAFLWLFFKVFKWIWKLSFVFIIFLGLSLAFPTIREWVFDLF